jgi:hypothetical protein
MVARNYKKRKKPRKGLSPSEVKKKKKGKKGKKEWDKLMAKIPKLKSNGRECKVYTRSKPSESPAKDLGKPINNYWDKFPK